MYEICIILHPPYIRYLREHLTSIKKALGNRKVEIHLVFSRVRSDTEVEEVENIIANVGLPIDLIRTEQPFTAGQARNEVFVRTKSKWVVFYDVDVILDPGYFDELEKLLESYGNEESIKAMAGGIGLSESTVWGIYESYMDLNAYLGKLGKNANEYKTLYDGLEKEFEVPHKSDVKVQKEFWENLMGYLKIYEGKEIGYLQGFNQIIHRDVLEELGGFDPGYVSAEDREIAARIRKNNWKVIFTPSILVFHSYKFTLSDIKRRKILHGIWSERFRYDYAKYGDIVPQYSFKKWFKFAISCINPPFLFKSISGRFYYIYVFFAYHKGTSMFRKSIKRNPSSIKA